MDMKLEVVTVPVADAERAKAFYESIGWRLDADIVIGEDVRSLQFTPPHSECSIHIAQGTVATAPGSLERLILTVADVEAARDALIDRGVEVSEVAEERPPGFESVEGRSYFATASFSDPDGNGWVLQEVTERLPGRTWEE